MVPVTVPVAGSTTGTVPEPGLMSVLEPGTLKPLRVTVVPAGAITSARELPDTDAPGMVDTEMGGASRGLAACNMGFDEGRSPCFSHLVVLITESGFSAEGQLILSYSATKCNEYGQAPQKSQA